MAVKSNKVLILKSACNRDKYHAEAYSIITAEGLIVCIFGGTKPHVGAIAVGIPTQKNNRLSATTSVFTLMGHKDNEIAEPIASRFAKATGLVTVTIAGLHIDNATQKDLAKLVKNATKVSNNLLNKIENKTGRYL